MELVSQEKPLVFYEPMEQPPVDGIKVKLNYADGSSKVVDASKLASIVYGIGDIYTHYKGMLFSTYTLHQLSNSFETEEPMLQPGPHRIAMYYVDDTLWWHELYYYAFAHNPEKRVEGIEWGRGLNFAYCMVDVYAQTAEEYIAEHNPPFAIVTETP